jgi:glucose-1-phosphate adenylyltransferase
MSRPRGGHAAEVTRTRTLALVLAGGAGTRLELLTAHRAKPAVPVAGTHRLVDVPLSCCAYAGIPDVWVLQEQHPASLADSLANGRPWDLDRTSGGLLVVPPPKGHDREGFSGGTADVLFRNAGLLREQDPEVLLLASSDAVYRMDYDALVREHLDSGAALTAVTAQVPAGEDASRFGVVEGDGEELTGYTYKPQQPASDRVATEVFVADPRVLLDLLEELAADADEDGLEDLGNGVLPRLVEQGRARQSRHEGYWRDVGTVASYWRGHQELLGPDPMFRVDEEPQPLRTRPLRSGAVRVLRGATVIDSLLSPSCEVAGTVERSVLAPGVVVEEGAVVRDSVLLPGVRVRRGAVVERAVLDDDVEVGEDARVGGPAGKGEDPAEGVALVGHRERVVTGTAVPAGGRQPAER